MIIILSLRQEKNTYNIVEHNSPHNTKLNMLMHNVKCKTTNELHTICSLSYMRQSKAKECSYINKTNHNILGTKVKLQIAEITNVMAIIADNIYNSFYCLKKT